MKVYCYPKCSTCKKAKNWLDAQNGAEYELFDIKTQNPDSQQIRSWYEMSGLPLKKFFNTSGMIYREMELSKKLPNMSEEEQIVLLASDGMLVKRPLVIGENYVLTGFKEAEWAEKILK